VTVDRTIAFVDLAGFTALTDVHGDEAAVDLVEGFTALATNACRDAGAELVKTVGDAVMLAATTPEAGLDAVARLFHAAYERDGFPEPRAGLHHGTVVERGGDYFGSTVNLAARVASRAGSGQALVTAPLGAAATAADLDVVALGQHQLRNVLDPVEVWAVELCATHVDISIDPVCRMRLSCQAAVARVRHQGVEHRFCSLACVAAFAGDPDRYLTAATS
jgi:class 3 adenylate cyclase/YHS domain-containing protein